MFGSSLTSQVKSIEGILDGLGDAGDGRDKTLAYGLATARRVVCAGMVPVREGLEQTGEEHRACVAKHYPNKGRSKPAEAIKRLLAERLPISSPGMEVRGQAPDTHEVIIFSAGRQSVFGRCRGLALLPHLHDGSPASRRNAKRAEARDSTSERCPAGTGH